jgi:hypothetical protein
MSRYLDLIRDLGNAENEKKQGGEKSEKSEISPLLSHNSLFSQVRISAEIAPSVASDRSAQPIPQVDRWRETVAALDPSKPPGDVPLRRWHRFRADARRFLESPFCDTARALGWADPDLFGCDPERPYARIDKAGLLWALNGHRLVAMTAETATIEIRPGVCQVYRRHPNSPGRVLPWEFAPAASVALPGAISGP